MKHIAFLCGVLAVSGCVGQSEFAARSSDLPGIPQTINCNPEPLRIYSKAGDLIELKYPILHPSCKEEAQLLNARVDDGFWDKLKFGPPTVRVKTLEAGTDPVAQVQRPTETVLAADPGPGPGITDDTTGPSVTDIPDDDGATPADDTGEPQTTPTDDQENEPKPEEPTGSKPARSKIDELKEHAGLL